MEALGNKFPITRPLHANIRSSFLKHNSKPNLRLTLFKNKERPKEGNFRESLQSLGYARNYLPSVELEDSVPYSQKLATRPYLDPE
jgi:hypothetical protein